jgi:DNA-3-methyladenine glycosylase
MSGGRVVARIVETEAYLGRDDPASHAYRGRLHDGNRALYSPPSTWYVYRSYGIHWCANLVTGPRREGAAVLLRAIAVLEGGSLVGRRRGPVAPGQLTNGPGKLCAALAMDRRLDGLPMRGSGVIIVPGAALPPAGIVITPRVGITKAADWPLRFLFDEKRERPPSEPPSRPPKPARLAGDQ